MGDEVVSGDQISATFTGSVDGQVAVGRGISQRYVRAEASAPTAAELSQLRHTIGELRARVVIEVPPERRNEALRLVTEFEEAVTADRPNLSTMDYVKNWFARTVPWLTGLVTTILVDPIVGKLVHAGGDALVSEYEQRFGGHTS
jgi:hypothetical protein